MAKRKASVLIREMIALLKKEGELSLRSLETKLNTNSESIKDYATLLSDLNLVRIQKNNIGKKIITTVKLK